MTLKLKHKHTIYITYYNHHYIIITLKIKYLFYCSIFSNHSTDRQDDGVSHLNHPHKFQHQSSVTSTTSVQTVLHQSIQNSNNNNNGYGNSCNESESSNSLAYSNMSQQAMNSLSISSAEEPLHIADVADLLHPQYAIITGTYIL